MNGALFLQHRSRRHMARLLEQFEALVEPHLTGPKAKEDAKAFKGVARDLVKEMVGDASDVMDALGSGQEINGHAVSIRDRVGATR